MSGYPRAYPTEVVERVRHLYVDLEMTRAEVQAEIGRGFKVETVMRHHGIPARRAIRRDQKQAANPVWAGASASYTASHTRVYTTRGRASEHVCVDCPERAKDWCYVGGCPLERRDPVKGRTYSPDPTMYAPRCRSCHRRFDAARRAAA